MGDSKKYEEGMEWIRCAEKSLKTSLFKWVPDHGPAADEYSKAAVCFKIAKDYEACRNAYFKARDHYKINKSFFHAARSMEQVILISKEMKEYGNMADAALEACTLYEEHGSYDSGILLLDKTAKILVGVRNEDALRLLKKASYIAGVQDNSRQAADIISKTTRLLVKMKRYDEAIASCTEEISLLEEINYTAPIGRLTVVLVLLYITRDDTVAADKAFKQYGNYCEQEEFDTLHSLLEAYEQQDGEGIRAALNSSFIKHMDVDYAKMAKELPIPKEYFTNTAIAPTGSITDYQSHQDSGNSANNIASDGELDLC